MIISFTPAQISQLSSRTYASTYVQIPNGSLPQTLHQQLDWFHDLLFGEAMLDDDSSFVVRAPGGVFGGIFGPGSVVLNEDGHLDLQWGMQVASLALTANGVELNGRVHAEFVISDGGPRLAIARSDHDQTLYVPLRLTNDAKSFGKSIVELLNDHVSKQDYPGLCVHFAPIGAQLQGPIFKIPDLPIGTHQVTGSLKRETKFGDRWWLQVVPDPATMPFDASVRTKIGDEWTTVTTSVNGPCVVIGNKQVERVMDGEPIIDDDTPAQLKVLSHGEFNGYKTADVVLTPVMPQLSEPTADQFGTF